MVICLQGFGPESTANNIAMAMQQGLQSRPERQGKKVVASVPSIGLKCVSK